MIHYIYSVNDQYISWSCRLINGMIDMASSEYVITQVLLNICFANLVSAIFIKSISIVHNGFVRIMFLIFVCVFVCKYLFICLTILVSAISIQSIWIIHNGFFLLPFHFFSSNSYIPYLILETVEIAKTAGFNNHLSFPDYTFFSILTGYWLNHVQREKGNLISIHDHQLTSSYRDQVYFAGMPWQREAQNHKLPFAWFTPLGTGTSVDGAVKFKY